MDSLYDFCGETGIRTPGTVSDTHAFQACSLSLSDISPKKRHSLTEFDKIDKKITDHFYIHITPISPKKFSIKKKECLDLPFLLSSSLPVP